MNRMRRDERGVAMVTVLLVTAVLTGLGVTITQVSLSNLGNAGRDRLSSGALGAAEAGVARAISFIHQNNTNVLKCSPTCASTGGTDTRWKWGNSSTPAEVSLPDGRKAKVWIEPVQPYQPPAYKVGTYRIHSTGTAGAGPGKRTLQVTVEVKPLSFPFGVYTREKLNNGGTAAIYNETVLSNACIDNRDKMTFVGIDAYYGIPAAAHSTSYITGANLQICDSNLANVRNNDKKAIHGAAIGTCNTNFPYDQDNAPLGGSFPAGSGCLSAPNQYTNSSLFTIDMLQDEPYNFVPRGLTDAQYALLRARAQAQGTYFTTTKPTSWPNAATTPNVVIYFKIGAGQEVQLNTELNSYAWTTDPSCTQQHPGLVLIVEGGDLRINSNAKLTGAVFVPDGSLTYNGGAELVGTVFTKKLTLSGNAQISLNECYTRSTPGGVLDIKPIRFREVDR